MTGKEGGGDSALVRELLEIARRCASRPLRDARSEDQILGYDERGVPIQVAGGDDVEAT